MKSYRALELKLLAAAGGCALLGACANSPLTDAKVDARSPIAAEVPKLVRADAAYPTFASVPAKPTDIRPRRQYGVAANGVTRAGEQLEKATADNTWTLQNTDTFTATAQTAVPDLPAPAQAETEAFAAALRKRATPPPQAKH